MLAQIPLYMAAVVVAGAVMIAAAIWSVLAWAAQRAELPPAAARRIRVGSALYFGAWLGAVLFLSPEVVPFPPSEVFDVTSMIPFAFVVSCGLFAALVLASASLRRTLAAIPVPVLHALQVWRVLGVVFIVLLAREQLPAHFALPAGWGDIFVGMTAPVMALALARRRRGAVGVAVVWNVFGLLDLLVAVGMGSGLLATWLMPGAEAVPPAAPMGAIPLVLVPAFAVPASTLIHILALRRLTRSVHVHAAPQPAAARK